MPTPEKKTLGSLNLMVLEGVAGVTAREFVDVDCATALVLPIALRTVKGDLP